MHPILIQIGPVTLHTYGLLVALGFLAGYLLLRGEFRRRGRAADLADPLSVALIVAGLVGARFAYFLVLGFEPLRADPLSFFRVWEGGLVFYGAFLGGVGALAVWSARHRISFLETTDTLAAPLLLAQAIGRLGCFAAGCCYGRPTDGPLGVVFTDPACLAPLGVSLHPAQLYSSAGNLVLFAAVLALSRRKPAKGVATAAYLLGYGAFRFLVEFLRGDDRGFVLAGLHPSQWTSLAAIAVGAVLLIVGLRNRDE